MRTLIAASSLGLLLVASGLQAQEHMEPPAARLLFRLEADGPAGWRTKFAPTNLGVMLASEEGARLWQPRLQPFDLALRRFLAGTTDGPGDGAARDRWVGYSGRMEFVLWSSEPKDPKERAVPYSALRFHGDGRTDLDALAKDLAGILARNGDAVGKLQASQPTRDRDMVVVLLGDAATFATSASLAKDLPPPDPIAAKGPALRMVAHGQDVDRFLRGFDEEVAGVWKALGFGATQHAEFGIGTAGPFVQFEFAAQFHEGDRGMFGAFFPDAEAVPPLLQFVPDDGTPWKAGHFDLAALWRTGCAVADATSGEPAGSAAAAVAKAWGVDPLADVFAHMHTDYLLLGMPGYSSEDGFVVDGLFVFRLRDAAKFAAGFERMRQNWKPHVQKAKEEDHDGVTITHFSTMFVPLQFAVAHGNAFVAIGPGGADRIRAALDRSKLAASAKPGEAWTPLLRHVPAGHNGVGEIDLHRVLTMHVSTAFALLAFVPQDNLPEFLQHIDGDALVDELSPLLERHSLRTLRSATGFRAGRWHHRMFW
ncbi:MAG: hypothetical protein JNK15_06250 [Planctomycetes bacterium]|nr:hypothetical protein [Planctomycetota bacterium]